MKQQSYDIFAKGSLDEMIIYLDENLSKKDESPVWKERVIPFSKAILSVLIPLRDSNLLFNPEKEPQNILTPELFFRWCDFVSLKMLYFYIKKTKSLHVDISLLEEYLLKNGVDINNERVDFPIATYNLHVGVLTVIKSLL